MVSNRKSLESSNQFNTESIDEGTQRLQGTSVKLQVKMLVFNT